MPSHRQQGSHHVIIIVAVTAVLIGAIGFMFWRNILNKSSDASVAKNNNTSTSKKTALSNQPIQSIQTLADGTQYLTLKDWGLKFKITDSSLKGNVIKTVKPKIVSPETTAFATTRMISDKGCGSMIGVELIKTSEVVDPNSYTKLPIGVNKQVFYVSKKLDISKCADQATVSKDSSAIQALLLSSAEATDPQVSSPTVPSADPFTGSTEPPASSGTIEAFNLTFKAPNDGTVILWAKYKYDTSGNTVGFTSSKVGGDICKAENGAIGSLTRSTTKITPAKTGSTQTLLNNGYPIVGYYYAFTEPNGQSCDTGDQKAETDKLESLLISTFTDS